MNVAITRFALVELLRRWRVSVALAVLVSIPLFALTIVDGYIRSLDVRFASDSPRLIVQQQGAVGQLAGSRIPASAGDELRALGVDDLVPEIHAVTGSTARSAVLVVGVDPTRYETLDHYRFLQGEGLRPDAPDRTVVLGHFLADRLDAGPGDTIQIRGRDVRVVGVFDTSRYLDDAAVLPLRDAQSLLGWGSDVSVFVIPAGGPVHDGDVLPGGLEAIGREDVAIVSDWDPVIRLLARTVDLLAIGALLVLASAVWRLAWLERNELGVLRLLGFRRSTVAGYVVVQSVTVVVAAAAVGVAAAVVVGQHISRRSLGLTTQPHFDATVIGRAAVGGLVVLAVAVAVPLVVIGRLSVRALLARDD